MTFASRPRLASSLALALGLLWALIPGGRAALAAAPAPALRLAAGTVTTARTSAWLREDGSWLARAARQPGALTALPADAAADSLRAAVLAAARVAVGDSAVSLRTLESRLRDRWLARGHLEATVTLRRGGATGRPDTLVVTPGAVWTLGEVEVLGGPFPGRDRLLATWLPRAGEVFDAAEFDQAVNQVLAGAGEAGRPFARWVMQSVKTDVQQKVVDVKAMLIPGEAAWLGEITTTLPAGRASAFAVRAAGLRPGSMFRQTDLDRAVERLQARDLYARVDAPVVYLTTARDTVGVHLPIVPRRKVNRAQVVLGLSRNEEGGSRISGQVDLDLPNLAGTGRALSVGWRDDGSDLSRFGFKYLEPLAFGTPLDTDIALDNEVQQGQYTRFRLDNRWRLPVVALWGVELGVGWDRSTYPEGAVERTNRTRFRGALLHRRGDRSRSGWEGLFAVEEARRTTAVRPDTTGGVSSGGNLGEAINQRIFEVDASGELWITRGLSLFARASFRELTGGDGVVPLSEQFRFGGAASLRGYREEQFNGTRAAWGALELRVGSSRGSRLYTFYDLGYFAFRALEPTLEDPERLALRRGWPRGYGLGILARTPGGDLSLAIGFPGTVDFDLAKLHVTLMESF